jgi:hypothetical protein
MSNARKAKTVMDALKALSRASKGQSINELRVIVALERAIARIEAHPRLSSHFVFKGGFVLLKTVDTPRFTRDVDALAIGVPRERVPEMIDRALKLDLDDGLWFTDLKTEDLVDQGSYGGYRFTCAFQIGEALKATDPKIKKLSRIHIDVGFGDPVESVPAKQVMRSILPEGKPVSWSVYPLEYIFAEKLETLYLRGSANSRAKDVYDLGLIFSKIPDHSALLRSIEHTFSHRKTSQPASFESEASLFDQSLLRSSWKSVELSDESTSFEMAWTRLMAGLRQLDAARASEV